MNSAATEPDREVLRQRLVVLCALDRAELRLALRAPSPPDTDSPIVDGVGDALQAAAILPGKFGRWSRRLAYGVQLFRGLKAAKN